MNILAIETSCDETAASIISASEDVFSVASNIVSSQIPLHAKWGGVVPSLAAREHAKNIVPVIKKAIESANISPHEINLIAVTKGPGLIPALLIGVDVAKTLAYAWHKPLIGVHHITGHIYANYIHKNPKSEILNPKQAEIKFPILCLVVSGGHTQLVLMREHLKYEIIGETQDDAVGEAFDKVSRMLGLGYPGGPAVSMAAKQYAIQDTRYEVHLPRPMIHSGDFNFSFSGLKTAVLYEIKKHPDQMKDPNYLSAVAHEFQQSAIDVLIHKTIQASEHYDPKTIMIAGGVSANIELRAQLGEKIKANLKNISYMMPDALYTGDNAAMIGIAAHFQWKNMSEDDQLSLSDNWKTIVPDANLKMV